MTKNNTSRPAIRPTLAATTTKQTTNKTYKNNNNYISILINYPFSLSLSLVKAVIPLRLDVRKFSFSQRVVNHWNALKQRAVDCKRANSFKRCLDCYIKALSAELSWLEKSVIWIILRLLLYLRFLVSRCMLSVHLSMPCCAAVSIHFSIHNSFDAATVLSQLYVTILVSLPLSCPWLCSHSDFCLQVRHPRFIITFSFLFSF